MVDAVDANVLARMTPKELESVLNEAATTERRIRDALQQARDKENAVRLEPVKALAARAHDLLCPYNHNDGCSWGYEKNDWNSFSHAYWLRHYDSLLKVDGSKHNGYTMEELNKILDAVVELKKTGVKDILWLFRQGKLTP